MGAGCALDAASRGLDVALVEARDLASGTSSRSSKLVHGGLRYLKQQELHLLREALKERDLLLNVLAPHLVRPVCFLYSLTRRAWEARLRRGGHAALRREGGHQGARAPPPPHAPPRRCDWRRRSTGDRVEAERASQRQPDDEAADAVRRPRIPTPRSAPGEVTSQVPLTHPRRRPSTRL